MMGFFNVGEIKLIGHHVSEGSSLMLLVSDSLESQASFR